jgi:hypothetical protein
MAAAEEEEAVEWAWRQLPHGEVRLELPIHPDARASHCDVQLKRNWVTVKAPHPTLNLVATLLDTQLYGAVDVEQSDWRIQRSATTTGLIVELQKAPIYHWPCLHRPNGLKKESDRQAVLHKIFKRTGDAAAKSSPTQANIEISS